MADGSRGLVAVLSIHPRFADAILVGSKQVEFRKVAFRQKFGHVLLYATSPIRRIIGVFTVAGIEEDEPSTLWRRYSSVSGIEREEFFRYFRDRTIGVALRVHSAQRLDRPLRLDELSPRMAPPQSFAYAASESLNRLEPPLRLGSRGAVGERSRKMFINEDRERR
jgi:predicted transcriptional regulator